MKSKKEFVFILGMTLCGVISFHISQTEARAYSHKVHNLALYPERHSWCQSEKIRQEISAHNPECKPLTIDNVVCLGACFSYSVPRAQDDAVIAPYCDACRPIESSWTTVALNCTKTETQERYYVVKSVELIANCSCVDCSDTAQHKKEDDKDDDDDYVGTLTSKEESEAMVGADLQEEDDEDISDLEMLPGIDLPTLHKLKSASAELKALPKGTEELMIKDNKISPDDDNRHDTHHN